MTDTNAATPTPTAVAAAAAAELNAKITLRVAENHNRRNTFVIRHPRIVRALELMEEGHRNRGLSKNPRRGIMILGESRAGKTTLLDLYADRYPDSVVNGTRVRRVLRLSFPSAATLAMVMQDLLRDLGDLFPSKGDVSDRKNRFNLMLKELGVEVLLFDESQQLVEGRSLSVVKKIADFLKELMDRNDLCCIMVGLPDTEAIIDVDSQIRNRFFEPLILQPFGGNVESDLRDLRVILRAIEKHYQVGSNVALSSTTTAMRVLLATQGLLGLIIDVVERASEYAIRDGRDSLTFDDLASAYDLYVGKPVEGLGNPFTAEVSRVQALFEAGRTAPAPTNSMKKRIRAKKRETKVSDVLQKNS